MNYCSITDIDVNNGLGCRVTLWISGCTHKCKGCHNKRAWDFKYGELFDEEAKLKLIELLKKPYIKGLTLSGGDPMDSYEDVLSLSKELKDKLPNKDIWLYSGYTLEEIIDSGRDEILEYIDVLVDGEYISELRDITLAFRGSKNQRILFKGKDF